MIAGKNSASTRKLTATGGNARCQPVAAASLYIDRPRVRSRRRSETADARALPMHLDVVYDHGSLIAAILGGYGRKEG